MSSRGGYIIACDRPSTIFCRGSAAEPMLTGIVAAEAIGSMTCGTIITGTVVAVGNIYTGIFCKIYSCSISYDAFA